VRFRVIDTIQFKSSWIHHYPEVEARGEGAMAILDPNQIQDVPEIEGRTIMICRPDGSVKQLVASSAEAPHSVVGIFFEGASSEDIPRGAELQW
jgi:hypothetical protein